MISIILLAAGESRRMGAENKLLLSFRGQPLIVYMVEHILKVESVEVIVVLGHEANKIRKALEGKAVTFVENTNYKKGMTTSIQAGVAASHQDSKGYLIGLSDLPLMESIDYQKIVDAFLKVIDKNEAVIVVPTFEGRKGHPIVFSAQYRKTILTHQEMEGCKNIVKENAHQIFEVSMENDHGLRDMDTPEDYQQF